MGKPEKQLCLEAPLPGAPDLITGSRPPNPITCRQKPLQGPTEHNRQSDLTRDYRDHPSLSLTPKLTHQLRKGVRDQARARAGITAFTS